MMNISRSIVFIDAAIDDCQQLAGGVHPNIDVVILRPDINAIQQITAALRKNAEIDDIHIVAHGCPGCLFLGNESLSLATVERYATELGQWFYQSDAAESQKQPTLRIYGCNVAAGDAGAEFLDKLHQFTGAAIYASQQLVGSAAQGGTWQLEAAIAPSPSIDQINRDTDAQRSATLVFGSKTLQTYAGVFAAPSQANLIFSPNSPVNEGTTVNLNGTFQDEINQTHTIQINWGDGTVESVPTADIFDSGSGAYSFNIDHIYTDNPTSGTAYTVTVTITDSENLTSTTTNLFTVNNLAPSINEANPVLTVTEDATTAATLTLTATDPGADTLTWSVSQPAQNGIAAVDSATGQISYTPNANFSGTDSVTIRVSDGDGGTDTVTVGINVTAVNDAPNLTGNAQLPNINEDVTNPTGQTVSNLFSGVFNDIDPGSSLAGIAIQANTADASTQGRWQYSTNGGGSWFGVGTTVSQTSALFLSANTLLRFVPAPNFSGEPPALTVRAIDNSFTGTFTDGQFSIIRRSVATNGGTTPYSASTGLLNVTVIPQNDAPVIDPNQPFVINVPENSPAETSVATFLATDPEGNPITWELINGNRDVDGDGVQAFRLSPSGQLIINDTGDLNFESGVTSFTLVARVTDSEGASSEATFTINITDVPEPPVIAPNQNLTFSLAEDAALNTVVGTLAATDPDAGSVLTWSIVSGNTPDADVDGTAPFGINNAGQIFVADPDDLDFESGNTTYTLVVQVSDQTGLTDTVTVTINLTDVNEAPEITTPVGPFNVAENTPQGTVVGAIAATDPDGDSIIWSITANNPDLDGDGNGAFAIDSNGNLIINDAGDLDFETLPNSFNLEITASDSGGLSSTTNVTVNVTDANEAPTDIALSNNIVDENTPGAAIGTLTVTDPDAGDTFTFSVNDPRFVFNGSDLQLAAGVSLDFETEPTVTIAITATDAGGLTYTETFIINVFDLSEAPVIAPGQVLTVPENSPAGTTIGTISAADPEGDISNWLIDDASNADADGDGEFAFGIDGSGTIFINDADEIDFETTPTYTLSVTAIDEDGNIDTENVTVNVTNVNEPPVITPGQIFNIAENSPIGTSIGTPVAVTDPENNFNRFRIVGGNVDNDGDGVLAFGISPAGQLFVLDNGDLNFEAFPTSYTLTLEASDRGGLTSTETITINVTNVNEPPFIPAGQTFDIDENSPTGTEVGAVVGTDPDGNIANWEIVTGNTNGAFAIAANGVITVANPAALDFEAGPTSYTLQLRATDADGASATRNVIVTVNNINEAPVITEPLPAFSVNENAANGTVVGTVAATDPENNIASWSISSPDADGDGTPAFAINNSGQITVADGDELDFESLMSIDVDVTVTDAQGLSDTETLTIELNPVNEAPDVAPDQSFTISEGATNGTVVGAIAFTDVDGVNEVGSIEFVDNDGDGTAAFGVDANNNIIVTDADELDFETNPIYTLDVTVTDAGGLSDTETVTITLTDVVEPPEITPGQMFTVPENSADGTAVGTVEAIDSDGDIVAWEIFGGNVDADDDGELLFSIDGQGNITVNDGDELDFETTPTYTLDVRVIDGQGNEDTDTVTVNVGNVNEAPIITPGQVFNIAENSPLNTTVGTVAATDLEGNLAGFRIVSGNPNNDGDGVVAFGINNQGRIFVTDSGDLNFEAFPTSYTLTIEARDSLGLTSTETITINITNVNEPPFIPAGQTFDVDENSPTGTEVGTVLGNDPDGNIANWEILTGDPNGVFTIDANGVITVADPALLDFEAGPISYTLQLRATDADGQSSTRNVTVTVNNVQEAPIITEPLPALAVDENAANGTVVGTIAATDPENNIVGWSINSPDNDGDGIPAFAINNNGQITVADGDELDFESLMSVDVEVTVTDSTGLTDTATVTIELNPVNEAPDVSPDQSFTISEGATNGTVVGAIAFTDVDGVNEVGTIEFIDNDGDGTAAFGVDANNNIIVTDADELDFETNPNYELDVTITDAGGLSDTETVTITLTNVDEPPVIAPDQVFTVPEDAADGDAVGTVDAVDSDGDIAAWAILSGNVDTDNDGELLFEIDNAGNITVNDSDELDFETTPSYNLGVRVIDGQGNIADATVTVEVDNVNEAPTVDPGQTFTVPENSAIGTPVGTVTATDLEDNLAGFQIVDGNPDNDGDGTGAFSINNAGQLFVIDPGDLDFENFPTDYTLTIEASDSAGLSSTGEITVSVTDVNEPPFIPIGQTFDVDEDAPQGFVFGTVNGGDPDTDPANQIANWEIVLATNPDNDTDGIPAFEISPTGELSVLDPDDLDAETYPTQYTVSVTAVDGQGLSSTRNITVNINDVNEAPVVDPGQTFTVDENASNGTVVGDITFTDPDANDTFTGSIEVVDADGDGTPAFSVQNGQIVVTDGDEIDFETNPTYTLNVTVTDAGGLSSTESVTIGVNDVNEAPVITTVDPVFNIDEGQPVGTLVGTIAFTDPDAPPNEVKTVTINSPDGDGDGTPLFAIDLNGNITVNDADELDFELFPTTYTLEVEVSDGTLSDTTTVTINVNDANELPVIDPGQVFTVAETAPNGTAFGTVAATDDDGVLLGWTIVGGNPDNDNDGIAAFRINSATGALVVNDRGDLDQEAAGAVTSYDLTVQVGDGIGTSQEVITVNIEDIDQPNDDFASAIQLQGVTDSDTGSNVDATAETGEPALSIPSNSVWWTWTAPASGLVIVDTFGSGFDTLLGVYTGTTVDALTEVAVNDDATGSVQSEVQFVAVQGTTYYFLVDGFQTQTGNVQINLNFDANEPPVIAPDQSFVVPENSPQGTVVGTVAASDADGTITSWAITDGNTDLDGDGTLTFSISDTGQIIVEDGDELNFESKTVFNLEITVTDNLGEVATQPVTVTTSNVNEAPIVTPGLTFDVSEAAPNGTSVGAFTATDPDGNADVVAWTISDADNPDLDGDGTRAFAISNTGEITVADTDDIDFEAAAPITQLTVTATDAGGLSSTEVVGINVTNADEAPVIDPGQSFEIDENIADTTAVGTVTATDPENDITTWAISDASNPDLDGDGTRAFEIDATGQITVADTDDINFTVADTITLEVTATDATNLSDTESVVININDTNQAPDILDGQVFDVLENSVTGTTVGTVDVVDSDGNLVNWEITGGNPDTDGDGSPGFTISSDGVITVLDGDELDFETAQSYALQVTVIDSFNASDTATVTVQIQDENESPIIQAGQTFSVDEGAALSTPIGTGPVVATDPDADDSLTWAITGGNINPDGDGAAAFGINPTTGELFVTDGNDIDASTNASVNLTIQVTDEAGNTDSETVVINVNDINEPPVIPSGQQFTVSENAANGAEIGTVADEDPEGNVTAWSIVSGNPDNDADGISAFAINNTGLLTVADAGDLDFESFPGPYTVRVQAGDGEFTIQQNITINIQNENDPPVIAPGQTFAFNEGSPNGTAIGMVTASDPESNIAGWAITAGNPDNDNDGTAAFAINNMGRITVADSNEIDFENLSSYSLAVQATDSGGATGTGTVGITVNNVDEAPRNLQLQAIPNTSTNFTVNLSGSFVDPDQGDPHTATIQWGDGTAATTLNLAAGNNAINGSHLYTRAGNYTVSVTVADAVGQVQTTQSVQVGNSNFPDFNRDNSPDIAWRNISTGQNSLWYLDENNARVGGGAPPAVADTNWRIEGIGDYDGDGQDDLVWRNNVTGQNSVWFMSGTTRQAAVALDPVTEAGWRLQGVGTFQANSLRRDDLIWRNQITGQNSIWIMNGTTRVGTIAIDAVTDTNWEIAGVGNFDNDGRLDDVVWRNYATGQNVLWRINADGTKSTQALPALTDTSWRIEGVSDFDGDGQANDLLWRNSTTGQTTTWFIGSDFTRQGVQALTPQVTDTNWRVVV